MSEVPLYIPILGMQYIPICPDPSGAVAPPLSPCRSVVHTYIHTHIYIYIYIYIGRPLQGGHFCGWLARLATSQGLLDLPAWIVNTAEQEEIKQGFLGSFFGCSGASTVAVQVCRDTSLIRPLGPYRRPMPRVRGGS